MAELGLLLVLFAFCILFVFLLIKTYASSQSKVMTPHLLRSESKGKAFEQNKIMLVSNLPPHYKLLRTLTSVSDSASDFAILRKPSSRSSSSQEYFGRNSIVVSYNNNLPTLWHALYHELHKFEAFEAFWARAIFLAFK
ncbi:hypothetical protein BO83DRAFT_385663 [Aspergillus eucalypticola CBS 122712]|uniref:Uncharacterized protein n=1 Tax=Aspergillus eucalypticola (strain CBS 122712 / IBT 29274) TaxID=1448314 RepID=A0A317W895_ASPEC|nr:uncharacterized protein BO83DRAFT_385663 [Aspergillus eucalypticola CBS 122712]PWY81258.1 hypothetical protein BO83DRAFT_385663 [Aspergillus eucalypticola CBS 122712]